MKVRARFERHLAADLSNVKVHHDQPASRVARLLSARAFAFGEHIVFGQGEYRPETGEGLRLLAHELTHVVQQRRRRVAQVQRRIDVKNPTAKLPCTPRGRRTRPKTWEEIARLIRILSGSTFRVDAKGRVRPASRAACSATARSRHTIKCLCDMVRARQLWQIIVDDQQWPHTMPPPIRTIVINSRCAPFRTMAWGGPRGSRRLALPQWRVLAHELCGHAHLMQQRAHPASVVAYLGGRSIGRIHHDPTVDITNRIAREVSPSGYVPRSLFASPHHGESIIHFEFKGFSNRARKLTGPMITTAGKIAAVMSHRDNLRLRAEVIGHSDRTGSRRGNVTTSWWRAHNVRTAIIKAFPRGRRRRASRRVHPAIARASTDCPATALPADCRKVDVYLFSREGSRQRYRHRRFTSVKLSAWARSSVLTKSKVRAVRKRLRSIRSVRIGLITDPPHAQLRVTFFLRYMTRRQLRRVIAELATLGVWTPAEATATERVLLRAWTIRRRRSLP